MTAKHTPGPQEFAPVSQIEVGRWSISERESSTGITINDCRGKSVARVPLREDDLDIARLIAAAPKLLAALKLYVRRDITALTPVVPARHNPKDVARLTQARAAIDEATQP